MVHDATGLALVFARPPSPRHAPVPQIVNRVYRRCTQPAPTPRVFRSVPDDVGDAPAAGSGPLSPTRGWPADVPPRGRPALRDLYHHPPLLGALHRYVIQTEPEADRDARRVQQSLTRSAYRLTDPAALERHARAFPETGYVPLATVLMKLHGHGRWSTDSHPRRVLDAVRRFLPTDRPGPHLLDTGRRTPAQVELSPDAVWLARCAVAVLEAAGVGAEDGAGSPDAGLDP